MERIIPIFSSCFSLKGKSILTFEDPPSDRSIISIAKENDINPVYVVDDTPTGLRHAYEQFQKHGLNLRYGLRFNFVNNIAEISNKEDLNKKIHKNILFPKNLNGYYDLIKLCHEANIKNNQYCGLLDYGSITKEISKNIIFGVPFYDSFIFNNFLLGYECIPSFKGHINPVFFVENNNMPFDDIIAEQVRNFCKDTYRVQPCKSIYYKTRSDYIYWLNFKINCNRKFAKGKQTSIFQPNIDHCGSYEFCFESYCDQLS